MSFVRNRLSVAEIISKRFDCLDKKQTNELFAILPKGSGSRSREPHVGPRITDENRDRPPQANLPKNSHQKDGAQRTGNKIMKGQLEIQEQKIGDKDSRDKGKGVKSRLHKFNSLFRTKI